MTIVKVPTIGKNGLLQDVSIGDAPPDVFTYAQNVRFRDGMAELMYGHSELSDNGATGFSPYYLLYNGDALDGYWLMMGLTKAYASSLGNGGWADVTRGSGNYTGVAADRWSGGVLNGIAVLTNNADVPQAWTNPSSIVPLVDLANWPANTTCKSIRPFKNYLIALNISETSPTAYYPHMVKWSDAAGPGTVPGTWNVASTTADAGEVDLPGADHIVDGGAMRDTFVIYKERSTHLMQWIGGQFVFKFSQAFTESGIIAKNCWTELNGQHVVLTASDLIIHDGFNTRSLLDKKMRRWLFQNIDNDNSDKCFVTKQWYFNEVWCCFPAQGETTCTQALVWNWQDNTISLRDLPNVSHAELGPSSNAIDASWASDAGVWAGDTTGWNSDEFTPGLQRVVMASPATDQLLLADSSSRFSGVEIPGELERIGLDLGHPDKKKLIRSIRPRFFGGGNAVEIQVGVHDDLHGPIDWADKQTFTIEEDFKVDFLKSGRYIALRITSTAEQWRLESLDFDIRLQGNY